MRMRSRRVFVILLAVLIVLFADSCAFRQTYSAKQISRSESVAPTPTNAPTPVPAYTVRFFIDGAEVSSSTAAVGEALPAPPVPEGVRLMGWTDEAGVPVDLSAYTLTGDTAFYALTRPLLNEEAPFLFPDEHGFLIPQSSFTGSDAAAALDALVTDPQVLKDLRDRLAAKETEGLSLEELTELLEALFAPGQVRETVNSYFPTGQETVDRTRAACCLISLLGREPRDGAYYPDVSPNHWAHAQLGAAAAPGSLDAASLMEQTLDGFVWFDGYLYRLDEDGYFIVSQTVDDLTYGKNGRYTSGSEDLDAYVARTLTELMEPGKTRLEQLRAAYLHVKNDFHYLPRNYYASGETGWTISEALTMYETGKGNCYNYTGVFWSLARGLGYNAVTYSGTMGTQNQPHSWTEILLDGQIYICDPEIELNYWLLEMYTDNFMMKRENAGGWNYQAVGRE